MSDYLEHLLLTLESEIEAVERLLDYIHYDVNKLEELISEKKESEEK